MAAQAKYRGGLRRSMNETARRFAGSFKLAIVETKLGDIGTDVIKELRALGFEGTAFTPQRWTSADP